MRKGKELTCMCGSIPVVGDIFVYNSYITSGSVEGVIASVSGGRIISTNGVDYNNAEIIIITKIK
jgi:hypothetical protein